MDFPAHFELRCIHQRCRKVSLQRFFSMNADRIPIELRHFRRSLPQPYKGVRDFLRHLSKEKLDEKTFSTVLTCLCFVKMTRTQNEI
ncbi:hypothetical protein JTE90_012539 [Oedothorax gibbosus]|uniref:Uncharacterized protein n=1 Tax=Oedothorax gibbosus TaxID=931172 RepID=A0AAV6U4C4_9ARAC|nr:hypothetical protein JTE90_012539 [Oedothorax gibbosus]